MAQYIFSRTEKKYAVPPSIYEEVCEYVRQFMSPDKDYPTYTLCNIYYDNDHFELARRSVEKPKFKQKLRMRSYGTPNPDSKVYVEIKTKYKGVVYKRRIGMKYHEAVAYLSGEEPPKDTQIAREITYFKNLYSLKPKVYIAYERIAFTGNEDKNLRLTMDTNIRYRFDRLSLAEGDEGMLLVPDGTKIMEIKAVGAFPAEILELIRRFSLSPVSFSKYGRIYQKHYIEQKEIAHV